MTLASRGNRAERDGEHPKGLKFRRRLKRASFSTLCRNHNGGLLCKGRLPMPHALPRPCLPGDSREAHERRPTPFGRPVSLNLFHKRKPPAAEQVVFFYRVLSVGALSTQFAPIRGTMSSLALGCYSLLRRTIAAPTRDRQPAPAATAAAIADISPVAGRLDASS